MKPRTLRKVFGRWCVVVGGWVVYSEFSILLWSKALVLDLDQAEQYALHPCPARGKMLGKLGGYNKGKLH